MANTFITCIAPAQVVDQCRQIAGAWEGGQGLFATPLTNDGVTVSHYISSGMISSNVHALLSNLPDFVEHINSATGAEFTEAEMQTLMDAMDLTQEPAKEAMARLGLAVWREQEESAA